MKKMKVLLVDDEKEFVEALAERLQMRDLSSDTVYDGEQAISFVEDKEPDVMVLDLKMPGIDGIEVLKRVKKTYPKIQIIILTGHGTEKDEEQARQLGAFDYMEKPVNIDDLVTRMKKAFRNKMENAMAAAAFAEAGLFGEAENISDSKKK